MPSENVVKTVTITGKTDGVNDATAALNRMTDSIKALNDNLVKGRPIAQDNAEGFRITGEGAATAANHLRQAAEAAYIFSPAFRGVVNEMKAPALEAANVALAATATGIVTATNYAGTGLVSLALAAEKVTPNFLVLKAGMLSTGLALEAFNPTLTSTAATIASKLLPALSLLGKALLIVDVIKSVADAWELGNAKLAEYVALSEKAAASGVSTDFFQRIGKAATDTKIPVDLLTTAFKNLNEATADQLGGTSAQQRLKELTDAGNFKGNSGVSQLGQANTTEEKFKAITSLIDQAAAKGERLAALDVAKTFLGKDVADNLAKDSDYLDKILGAADAVAAKDLVSQASVDNAVALQNRLDAAEQILSQRWHPIQDLLTQLGIKMKEAWVDIVEAIAKAVDFVFTLAGRIADALAPILNYLTRAEQVLALAGRVGSLIPGVGAAISGAGAIAGGLLGSPAPEDALTAARNRLGSGLSNPANVNAARDQVNAIQNKVFADTSKNPTDKTAPDTAAYDRATESILKYIEVTKAAAGAVSDAAGAQEKFKVIAQLTAAAEKDGTPITDSLRDSMNKLADRAAAAADALAKAKQVSSIEFGAKTAFLSADDVAIAQQLKGIYGNDVPAALNSTYAAGIRVNTALKTISSSIETSLTSGLTDLVSGTKSAGQAFSDMSKTIITAIEQMIIKITIVQPLMNALQASIGGGSGILGLLGIGGTAGAGAAATSASTLSNNTGGAFLGPGFHAGGIVGSEPTFHRYIHPAYFDDAPRFHTGGIAGDEVPIIARKGEGVFTPGQMAALGGNGGSSMPNVTINNYSGAQPTVSRGANGDVTITLKKAVDSAVGNSLSNGTGRRVLRDQYGVNQFTGT